MLSMSLQRFLFVAVSFFGILAELAWCQGHRNLIFNGEHDIGGAAVFSALENHGLIVGKDRSTDQEPSFQRGNPREFRRLKVSSNPKTAYGSNESMTASLRRDLLENYDRNTFPFEDFWKLHQEINSDTNNLRMGIPVEVGINFHKVHEVDVSSSTVDLVVWLRLTWTDPRLSWNPEEYGNVTSALFWIEDGMGANEVSEIWSPDIYLWNQEEPIAQTLDNVYAAVSASGRVYWSRPGRMKATCRFGGLNKFPFDSLSCTMEVGSWAQSGNYIRPIKFDGVGFSIGGSITAGQSYEEFDLKSVECEEYAYPSFPIAPDEEFPVLLYTAKFDRSSEPYVRGFVLTQILLNFCGFCCFWIRPHVGERMALAITALLASVANDLTVTSKLPAASELNWFSIFSLMSTTFAFLVIFQSTVVVYLHFYTGDNLTPTYIKWAKVKLRRVVLKSEEFRLKAQNAKEQRSRKRDERMSDETDRTSSMRHSPDDPDGVDENEVDEEAPCIGLRPSSRKSCIRNGNKESLGGDRTSSVVHFLDTLQGPREARPRSLEHIGALPAPLRRSSMLDAGDFCDARARENNLRWQKVASAIDEASRLIFPSMFVLCIAILSSQAH